MNLHFSSLADIGRLIEGKDISPVELTNLMLTRLDALNPQYHAYSLISFQEAREAAIAAEKDTSAGGYKGPLHGVPIAVKDLFQTRGMATACGSVVKKGWMPTEDATVVKKLKDAGAVILGKLNMTEFALSGYHPDLPVPVNPWGHDRWSGVSSSGSGVATAAGMAFGTLGSDTGGSIRYPAAANGVVGIKPTFGRVSNQGVFPVAHSLDHVGPIARTVKDAAILLQAIAGHDPKDPFSQQSPIDDYCSNINNGLCGLRIGIDEEYCSTDAHPEVTAAVLAAAKVFEEQGAVCVPVDMLSVLGVCQFWGAVVAVEAGMAHEGLYPEQAENYGPVFRSTLEAAPMVGAKYYAQALIAAAKTRATFDNLLADVDLLLCPGAPLPAMPLSEFPPTQVLPPEAVASFVGFTAPMNFSGHPTISIPCGFSSDDLPLGLQLVGGYNREVTLITAAQAFERATDWHTLRPSL